MPDEGLLRVTATITFQFYGAKSGERTPMRDATYTIAAANHLALPTQADLDADGINDAWESAFNLTDPNNDADLDGHLIA